MAYTTSDLIADVELRTFAPTDSSTFQSTDILLVADAKMQTVVLPLLKKLKAEWYVATPVDHAITANQTAYPIPARAVGMNLRDVQVVTSSGDVWDLPQISPEDVDTTGTGEPEAFYIRGNNVMLYPTPATTQNTLRLSYELRPGKLVLTTAAAVIASFSTPNVTVSSVPSAWTTSNTFDLIKQDGASEPLAIDYAASSVSTTITFTSALPSTLRVGDYVALAGESPLLTIPAELRPVLAQAVAVQIIASMGLPGFDNAAKMLKLEIDTATEMLAPRVQGEVIKMVARHGWL